MVVTDLDGTLLNSDRRVSTQDRMTLEALHRDNILRVIATGRSLYSFNKVIPLDFPIDYLIFSSGAGIMHWQKQQMLRKQSLHRDTFLPIVQWFQEQQFDFMIQHAIPDNHCFFFHGKGEDNPDFHRRIKIYSEHAEPLNGELPSMTEACQLVAIFRKDDLRWHKIAAAVPDLTVIRATSPLDHSSTWIEIFPKTVSKSQSAQWICDNFQTGTPLTLAIGNDYNDLDLLHWADHARVANNAPAAIKSQFPVVRSNNHDGFTHAVHQLMQ